jgi:hypothetical protein
MSINKLARFGRAQSLQEPGVPGLSKLLDELPKLSQASRNRSGFTISMTLHAKVLPKQNPHW